MATKEEKFLAALFKLEQKSTKDCVLDPRVAAGTVGLSDKSMRNSINMLAQINFLKKCNMNVQMTPQGREFVLSHFLHTC